MATDYGQYAFLLIVFGILGFGTVMYLSVDEFPQFSTGLQIPDKALCYIVTENGTAQCTLANDTFTFFAGPGMIIENSNKTLNFSTTGSGEANTASNLGLVDLFNSKVGVDLQFRSLQAGAGVSLLQKDNNVLVNSTSNQTGLNVGDFDLFKQQILNNLQFRGLTAGSGVALTQYDNNVLINATGTGEANTARSE